MQRAWPERPAAKQQERASMSPGSWVTIPAMARDTAERFGDRLAVVDGDTRLTWTGVHDEAQTFGAALVASGVEPGDRVALWAPNSADWIVALLGLLQAGAVLVPVNTRFKGVEAADILSRSRARALVTVTDFLGTDYLGMLGGTGTPLPDLQTTVVARGPAPAGAVAWSDFRGRATVATRAALAERSAALSDGYPSDILFTSGTTGSPKGVVMTHGRTLCVATDWVAMTVLARVAGERVTVLPGPPTLYQSILDHPARDDHDLSSLRVAVTGAADIPVALIGRIADELPFPTIVTGYGLTEAGTASATGPGDDADTIATTVGRARPGFEVRIAGADRDLPVGETGEILLRGPSIMAGYLDD